MNPRTVALRYLGWCPGVESAARFMPDQDLPTSKIVASLLVGLMVSLSGFLAVQQLQIAMGVTGEAWRIFNRDPSLVMDGDSLHLFASVTTEGVALDPIESSFRTRIDLHGNLLEKSETPGAGDAVVVGDGSWVYAYVSDGVKVVESRDGATWSEPVTVAQNVGEEAATLNEFLQSKEGFTTYNGPSLAIMGDGRLFLSFTGMKRYNLTTLDGYFYVNNSLGVYYSVRGLDGRWAAPRRVPGIYPDSHLLNFSRTVEGKIRVPFPQQPSCFTLLDGRVGLVCLDGNAARDIVKGIWLTIYDGSNWTAPRYLFHYKGRNPEVLTSPSRAGYYLAYSQVDTDRIEVTFTPDLETWGRTQSLPVLEERTRPRDAALCELADGTVVAVYESYTDLYLSYSVDGLNWSEPRRVEEIVPDEAFRVAGSNQMALLSGLVGVSMGMASIVIVLNLFGRR